MREPIELPSQEMLLKLLSYDPKTGLLTWRERAGQTSFNKRIAGKPALNSIGSNGYRHGAILGINVTAHRVIWKMLTGTEPPEVDHRNGIRPDNRKRNLREGSSLINKRNMKLRKDNSTGICGVVRVRRTGKWMAYIGEGGKQRFLGNFDNQAQAAAARAAEAKRLGFDKRHGTLPDAIPVAIGGIIP